LTGHYKKLKYGRGRVEMNRLDPHTLIVLGYALLLLDYVFGPTVVVVAYVLLLLGYLLGH
jgi:hypothetical protein